MMKQKLDGVAPIALVADPKLHIVLMHTTVGSTSFLVNDMREIHPFEIPHLTSAFLLNYSCNENSLDLALV